MAELLSLSPGDMGNRKQRGTLLPKIMEWAISEGEDLNEIVYGPRREPHGAVGGADDKEGSHGGLVADLPRDEVRMLSAYRDAGEFKEDLLSLAEAKATEARVMARLQNSGLSPPERKRGAGGAGR